jgi:hypothetical protein
MPKMRTWMITGLLLALPALGQKVEAPHHLFNLTERLTAPSGAPRLQIAQDYLRGVAADLGLTEGDLAGVYLTKEYRTEHNGVTHLVFRQRFDGIEIENAEWVVNIDPDGQVINAGGSLFPQPSADQARPNAGYSSGAVRAAAASVDAQAARRYAPFRSGNTAKGLKFAAGGFGGEIEAEPVWHGTDGVVRASWRVSVTAPDGTGAYDVVVDEKSGKVLAKRDVLLHQNPPAPPRGLVFERNSPQPNPTPGVALTAMPPLVQRSMQSFAGDKIASPLGWVTSNATAGNNVVAGANPTGIECITGVNTCRVPPITVVAPGADFSFPLDLGPNAAPPSAFSQAATVNLFYWVNRAHDLFYSVGFDEPSGNFQQFNGSAAGVEGDAVYAYAQDGIQASARASLNNANFGGFRIEDDGTRPRMAMYIWDLGGFFTDGDLDADVIVHEYTHGVSFRLARQLYTTFQGGAMGEAWSDFFSLEFVTSDGAPADGVFGSGAYVIQDQNGIRSRPYTTNFDINPLTFADLAHVIYFPEVHADGEIWVESLWQVRSALIKQYGDKEGRRRMRLLAIDSMKLSVPAPSMVDARDAILLANQVDFNGASQDLIWAAFAQRGLGVLAQSGSGSSVHIKPSFDTPSNTGIISFYEDNYTIGESVRVLLYDGNLKSPTATIQLTTGSGDLETMTLRKRGAAYLGTIGTGYAPVFRSDGFLQMAPSDQITAYYTDFDTGAGGATQVSTTVSTSPDYATTLAVAQPLKFNSETGLGFGNSGPGAAALLTLPFGFPFFGKTYRSAYVYNNGLITFDLVDFSPCTDVKSLALDTAIAPMWMISRTDGTAQNNEDVYVSTTPGAITFRWASETSPDVSIPGFTAAPSPLNYAATLHQDGSIEFRYGSGNNNLVSGSQLLGCPAGTATVGISNGHETFTELAITNDSQGSLENALTVGWLASQPPSFGPQAILETPANGDTVQGLLSGKGIVYTTEPGTFVRRVDVLVDGVARVPATLNVSRPDFCQSNKVPGCPNVGFTFSLSTAFQGVSLGKHTLQLIASNTRGGTFVFPDKPVTFTVASGDSAPYAKLEAPADGAQVSGRTTVSGYFALPDSRISSVDVIVDGITFGAAQYGIARASVCATLPGNPPNCPNIGFTFSLNTAAQGSGALVMPNGPHTLQVRARDQFSRFFYYPDKPITIVVNNPADQFPKVVIATPTQDQKVTGNLAVSGYAYDPDGRVVSVRMVIDGLAYGVTYGTPRPDVCGTLTNVPACPNIGFDAIFDSRRLSNGPHTVQIVVTDDKGSVTYAPSRFGAININVQN